MHILTVVLVALHLMASSGLLIFILLHAGRGGGLSDLFGGGGSLGGSMAGSTIVEKNLDRLTIIAAVIFTFTTIMLALRLK